MYIRPSRVAHGLVVTWRASACCRTQIGCRFGQRRHGTLRLGLARFCGLHEHIYSLTSTGGATPRATLPPPRQVGSQTRPSGSARRLLGAARVPCGAHRRCTLYALGSNIGNRIRTVQADFIASELLLAVRNTSIWRPNSTPGRHQAPHVEMSVARALRLACPPTIPSCEHVLP